MLIRPYEIEDQVQVLALWKACDLLRPPNDPVEDIARKLQVMPELFLVAVEEAQVVATVMGGYEGRRGWVNNLAVSPSFQGRGLGRKIMQVVEQKIKEKGGPKVNLQVRSSNAQVIAFYKAIGYEIDEVISLGKRL